MSTSRICFFSPAWMKSLGTRGWCFQVVEAKIWEICKLQGPKSPVIRVKSLKGSDRNKYTFHSTMFHVWNVYLTFTIRI